jgi:hypothetical protein
MATTELYGVEARLIDSVASTPVSTDTNIIFIGASPNGELNKAQLITSMADYKTKLGGEPGDGYNLTEAAIAAFSIAGINRVYMIPVSNSTEFDADDYIGDAELFTGVYAIENLLRENPTAVNILCAPSISDSSVIEALNTIAKKADGHWVSFMVYDVSEYSEQLNEANAVNVDAVVKDKQLNDELADAVWGHVKTSGGYFVSGAAVRACLMAKSDANRGVPYRCGGNLAIPGIQGIGRSGSSEEKTSSPWSVTSSGTGKIKDLDFNGETLSYDSSKVYTVLSVGSDIVTNAVIINNSGVVALQYDVSTSASISGVTIDIVTPERMINLTESAATQLSADGICSYINYGGGNWHTWGDHTSAFTNGGVSDERARFDNTIRMNIMITNRFQLKYRFEIDNPMTLQMRNDVINEELDYLNGLVAIEALIGEPVVEFRAADNGTDQVSQGHFTWTTLDTPTIPAKHMLNKVAFTQAGLSVYTQAA